MLPGFGAASPSKKRSQSTAANQAIKPESRTGRHVWNAFVCTQGMGVISLHGAVATPTTIRRASRAKRKSVRIATCIRRDERKRRSIADDTNA